MRMGEDTIEIEVHRKQMTGCDGDTEDGRQISWNNDLDSWSRIFQ